MDSSWIPFANFALNLILIPLLKVLWDIRQGLTRLEVCVRTHGDRLDRLERQQDMPAQLRG